MQNLLHRLLAFLWFALGLSLLCVFVEYQVAIFIAVVWATADNSVLESRVESLEAELDALRAEKN